MKWVTREKARVDRIACPWLITRFIDKDAVFLFVPADQVLEVARREAATPFDVPGVRLGHRGEECSFDAFLDEFNLKDPALGLSEELAEFVAKADVGKGRLHIALGHGERDAALTINEFETLLMKYDLAAVLRNPFRFMAEETRQALANPRAVPGKALGYARYDLVRVLNTGLSTLGLRGSLLERILAATLAVPAARVFRVRRSISLLVAETDYGRPAPVEGVYQSPILIQWRRAARDVRELDVTLYRLE